MLRVSVVTSAVALGISAFWWVWQVVEIVQSGSFGVDMPAYRVPVKLALEEFPAEFGVFLILAPLGLFLVARRLLRERRWRRCCCWSGSWSPSCWPSSARPAFPAATRSSRAGSGSSRRSR